MKKEIWKDIPSYQGLYQVSNMGRVRSLDREVNGRVNNKAIKKGKILKPSPSKTGYLRCVLCKDSYRNISVHRLVAIAFLENDNPLIKNQVNHKDGIKTNNTTDNLEWCDVTHNNRHARAMGLNVTKKGKENHSYGLNNKQSHILINNKTRELKSVFEVSLELGYSTRHITMMMKGERTNKTEYTLMPK